MLKTEFIKLRKATSEIAHLFNQWENDPYTVAFSRPSKNIMEMKEKHSVTMKELSERLKSQTIYLICLNQKLIGEMNYQINAKPLLKKDPLSVWISILIGEKPYRGRGIGFTAMQYLEEQIRVKKIQRIELGVFEFNKRAIALYKKLGYEEIARIDNFTYWHGSMRQDIRMEKYLF